MGEADGEQDDDEKSSDTYEPKPQLNKKLFKKGKPTTAAADDSDEDAEEADEAEQDVEAESKPAKPKNKVKPAVGKFAKWKEAIAQAFELVDEDAIEYMFFDLTGPSSSAKL